MDWQFRAIRGAITVPDNTVADIEAAVTELLDTLESRNAIEPGQIISATFSVTRDLDAIFPAAVARQRPGWDTVALLDVQHMHVEGSLPRCIRLLIHAQLPVSQATVYPIYLGDAQGLRPDLGLTPISLSSSCD